MCLLFTCPDVVGYRKNEDEGHYVPTIYTVEAHIGHTGSLSKIIKSSSLRILDNSPVIERRFLRRPIGQKCELGELLHMLMMMPSVSLEFDEHNSSTRQRIWSGDSCIGDIRQIMARTDELQFPPFGEYFTGTEDILEEMEKTWRKLDARVISHGFPAKMHHHYRD